MHWCHKKDRMKKKMKTRNQYVLSFFFQNDAKHKMSVVIFNVRSHRTRASGSILKMSANKNQRCIEHFVLI